MPQCKGWVQEKFLFQKQIWGQNNLCLKYFGEKNVGSKNFWIKKCWVKRDFWSKAILDAKEFSVNKKLY